MNQQEWLVSTDPRAMMTELTGITDDDEPWEDSRDVHRCVTPRKMRLFCEAATFVRHPPNVSVDWSEFAFNVVHSSHLTTAGNPVRESDERCAALLREIFGNPWKQYEFSDVVTPGLENSTFFLPKSWLRWSNALIPRLAASIYEERRFEDMPILADELENAGCTNQDILRHCRSKIGEPIGCPRCDWTGKLIVPSLPRGWQYCPHCKDRLAGQHVRGCWVIDLLLGKE